MKYHDFRYKANWHHPVVCGNILSTLLFKSVLCCHKNVGHQEVI